jgi:hypothetical protein
MVAFREALPAQFFIVEALFGQGIGFGQLRPPVQKLIGSFV